jgi:hypothetical protein
VVKRECNVDWCVSRTKLLTITLPRADPESRFNTSLLEGVYDWTSTYFNNTTNMRNISNYKMDPKYI